MDISLYRDLEVLEQESPTLKEKYEHLLNCYKKYEQSTKEYIELEQLLEGNKELDHQDDPIGKLKKWCKENNIKYLEGMFHNGDAISLQLKDGSIIFTTHDINHRQPDKVYMIYSCYEGYFEIGYCNSEDVKHFLYFFNKLSCNAVLDKMEDFKRRFFGKSASQKIAEKLGIEQDDEDDDKPF